VTGAADLKVIEALAGTGLLARTGSNAWALRTLIAQAGLDNILALADGDGVAGNPTISLPTRAANFVFAGPASGADAQPSFRALVAEDIEGGGDCGCCEILTSDADSTILLTNEEETRYLYSDGDDGCQDFDKLITLVGLTMATARLLGRTTESTGAVEELTVGSSLTLSAGSIDAVQDIRQTAAPLFNRLVLGDSATPPGLFTGFPNVYVANDGGTAGGVFLACVDNAGGPLFLLRKTRGSFATPTAVDANDALGTLTYQGYEGSNFQNAAQIVALASEDWVASTALGSYIFFRTVLTGETSIAERMRLSGAGNLLVGTTSDPDASGPGNLRVSGILRTKTPSGGTQGEWALGTYDATPPTPTGRVRVEIGGTAYYLPAEEI
jgi:hypothetical protein